MTAAAAWRTGSRWPVGHSVPVVDHVEGQGNIVVPPRSVGTESACCRPDRRPAVAVGSDHPPVLGTDAAGAAGADRARSTCRAVECRYRPRPRDHCRHGPQVAETVLRQWDRWVDRSAAQWPSPHVHRGAGRRGQGRSGAGPVCPHLGHEPLGADDYVLSADEKPGVQARHRLRRSLGPAARRPMRVESEYQRGGTLAYFAAYDVHRAHVIGRCEPTTGIEPFGRPACRAGHDQRALPQCAAGVLDRRQRSLPPQLGRSETTRRRLPERAHGAPAGPRLLA